MLLKNNNDNNDNECHETEQTVSHRGSRKKRAIWHYSREYLHLGVQNKITAHFGSRDEQGHSNTREIEYGDL